MNKRVILFELNEVPFRVVDDYAAKHPKSALAKLLPRCTQFETLTPDRTSLSPWKTWPTLHRGVNDEKHLIQDFGQDLAEVDREFPPLWTLLAQSGVRVGLCGSLHSYPPPTTYDGYAFYLPDTFAAGAECFPASLGRFQRFNLSMARDSARNVSKRVPWREALRLLASAPDLGLKASTLAEIGGQLIAERVQGWRTTRRRSYQSVLAFDIFMDQLEKTKPDFATFFTNHVASAQHRYWAAAYPGDYADFGYTADWKHTYAREIDFAMRKTDAMLRRVRKFADAHGYQLWITSSMGQAATQALPFETQLYLGDVDKFMAKLGMASADWSRRPAMLPQVNVVLRDDRIAPLRARLGALTIAGKPMAWRESAGGHFSLDFGHENLSPAAAATLDGKTVTLADLGLSNVEIDDKSGTSAYHVPTGHLLIYDPASAPAQSPRSQISTTEIAPYLLRNYTAAVPGYMPKPPALAV